MSKNRLSSKIKRLIKNLMSIIIFLTIAACTGGGGDSSRNGLPLADAGKDQIVTLQSTPLPLDGRASIDEDGYVLNFQWELTSKPMSSSAFLLNDRSATPSLSSVDFEGVYEISLTVNDGLHDSEVDIVVIQAVTNVRNIILIIGDGMGFEQVRAAGLYANGVEGLLSFERLPYQGYVNTLNARGEITDSAAAATAMATGIKVDNGVVSKQIPGNASDLETILETAKRIGASTGLVTTTTITHATPASFGAHETNRNNFSNIALDYLNGSRPNFLMGGAQFIEPAAADAAGYTVIEDFNELTLLNTDQEKMVWGQFGETQMPYEWDGIGNFPHLSEATETALDVLDNDPDGFFLMVEGGRIDHAGHINDIRRNIYETIELSNTTEVVMDWAAGRVDTLIIVTTDHETGGLEVLANNGQGNFPEVVWSTSGHTTQEVPVYAWGVNAHLLNDSVDNTDIFTIMYLSLIGK